MIENITDRERELLAEVERLSNLCDKWNMECDEMRDDNKRLASELAAIMAQSEPVASVHISDHKGGQNFDFGYWGNLPTGTHNLYATPHPASEVERDAECHWHQDDDDGAWGSDCGHWWAINDGLPSENNMKFCHGCGKRLVEHPFKWPEDEDDGAITKGGA